LVTIIFFFYRKDRLIAAVRKPLPLGQHVTHTTLENIDVSLYSYNSSIGLVQYSFVVKFRHGGRNFYCQLHKEAWSELSSFQTLFGEKSFGFFDDFTEVRWLS
jgi:hypothetical protein